MTESSESWSAGLVGRVLAGRYRVTEVLGAGGVGAVFAAVHIAVGRRVALKALHPEMLAHASMVERFHREARAAAACARRGVVDVLDLDQDPACGPFLVMEHLEGETLSARLRQRAPLPLAETLHIAHALLHTLEAVHAKGIVHRDLKPGNVMLARTPDHREVVKILDFGLARHIDASKPALTLPGSVLGTPRFMAPEQAAGDPTVDARADVYAVGAILYCCLGGRPPYSDVAPEEALHAVLLRPPTPLDRLRPDLSADLVAIVTRAMARERDARFADAASLRAALEAVAPGFDAAVTVSEERVLPPLEPASAVTPAPIAWPAAAGPPEVASVATAAVRAPLSRTSNAGDRVAPTPSPRAPTPSPRAPTPSPRAPTPSPRAPRRTLLAGLAAVVVVSALLGTALVVALISQRDEPSVARSSSAPVAVAAPAPFASPAATTPVVPAPATPASPLPSPVVAPARPAVPTAPGLERHPERGELRCSTGVHDLSGVVLDDLPLRIVLFVMGDCQLTCTACTFVGSGPVVLLSERGRLTLVRSTVTARDGAALYVGSEARATVVDSRLTGRLPTDVQGTLTTRGSTYASGVERAAGARVIDEGGNTGLRR